MTTATSSATASLPVIDIAALLKPGASDAERALVADAIGHGSVSIFGRGEIACAIRDLLVAEGKTVGALHGRDSIAAFLEEANTNLSAHR